MTQNTTRSSDSPEGESSSRSLRSLSGWFVRWLAGVNMFALMGVFFAVGFLAEAVPPLAPYDWVFFLLGGILPILLATVSTEEDGYDHEMSNRDRATFVASMLRWAFTPWGIYTQFLQIAGTLAAYLRYLGRLPNRDRHVPKTELTLPFDGEWTTVNGGVTQRTSHSWGIVSQRYAYDFVVTDADGDTHAGDGGELTDYYAFGKPIRAPADGTVVKTKDSLRDYPKPGSGWIEWRTWDIAGNHVVVRHADGEYSLLAHLQEGSVTVEPGDEVARGDVVGACGNSGASTEPHLHFQIQDSANFWFAAGLVPRFVDTTVARDDDRRADHEEYDEAPESGDGLYLWAGDVVSPVGG
ncbi:MULTISPECIES: M23 family metallopeptidase [Halorussus]|uniref:M23 family metallopeptidase n=1 Tax=Halorussus TaxID=1070314 RepID=UPI00209D0DFB|nr:M23 family metallopeptidase [Halorussus vallis]USZ74956.1 M23 family metallopeptidase [Halorussus vallis]